MPGYQIFKSKVKTMHNQGSYRNHKNIEPHLKLLTGKNTSSQMSHTFYGGNTNQANGPYVDPFLASAINYNKVKSKQEHVDAQKERNLEESILKQLATHPK